MLASNGGAKTHAFADCNQKTVDFYFAFVKFSIAYILYSSHQNREPYKNNLLASIENLVKKHDVALNAYETYLNGPYISSLKTEIILKDIDTIKHQLEVVLGIIESLPPS